MSVPNHRLAGRSVITFARVESWFVCSIFLPAVHCLNSLRTHMPIFWTTSQVLSRDMSGYCSPPQISCYQWTVILIGLTKSILVGKDCILGWFVLPQAKFCNVQKEKWYELVFPHWTSTHRLWNLPLEARTQGYTLWWTNIAMEKSFFFGFNGQTNYKWASFNSYVKLPQSSTSFNIFNALSAAVPNLLADSPCLSTVAGSKSESYM